MPLSPFQVTDTVVVILKFFAGQYEEAMPCLRDLGALRVVNHHFDTVIRLRFFATARRLPKRIPHFLTTLWVSFFPNLMRLSLRDWNKVAPQYTGLIMLDIGSLSRLVELDLSRSRFHPVGIEKLTNLQRLLLRGCYSVSDISTLTGLTELSLLSNDGLDFDCLLQLTRLQSLNVGCSAKLDPDVMSQMTWLTTLKLNYPGDRVTGAHLLPLTNLRRLSLRHCLGIADRQLCQMTWLTHIDVADCDWLEPDTIACLTRLESLDISSSDAADVVLSPLTNLTALNIGSQRLRVTDRSVSRLTRLRTLILDVNTEITDACLSCLVGLERLSLQNNECITRASLGKLTRLTELDVTGVDDDLADYADTNMPYLKCLRTEDSNGLLLLKRVDDEWHSCPIPNGWWNMSLRDVNNDDSYCRDCSSVTSDSDDDESESEEKSFDTREM